jgi:hypothetical protein
MPNYILSFSIWLKMCVLCAAFDKAKALSQMEGKNYAAIKHSFRTAVAEKIAAYGAVNLGG